MTDKNASKNAKEWCLREGNKYLDQLEGFSRRCREGLLDFENEPIQHSSFVSSQIMAIFLNNNLAEMVNEVMVEMQKETQELTSAHPIILPERLQ